MNAKEYLSDGVYIQEENSGLTLITEDERQITNLIILDDQSIEILIEFLTRKGFIHT